MAGRSRLYGALSYRIPMMILSFIVEAVLSRTLLPLLFSNFIKTSGVITFCSFLCAVAGFVVSCIFIYRFAPGRRRNRYSWWEYPAAIGIAILGDAAGALLIGIITGLFVALIIIAVVVGIGSAILDV